MTQSRTARPRRNTSPRQKTPTSNEAPSTRNKAWITAGGALAALAGTALLNHVRTRRAEAKYPPIGKFVDVDGVKLHYVDRGDGPAVVLLHGNGVMLQDFEASGVLSSAAERHRVIAFDRPGFGYSERPRTTIWTPAAQAKLIVRALEKIGVERAIIVGHSWGTMVALAMALDHPNAVVGLVLLSGYYYGSARPDVLPFSVPAIPLLGDVFAHTLAPLAGLATGPVALKASFSPATVSEKFSAFPMAMTFRPSQVRATAADTAMMVPAAIALSRRYGELKLPVIVLAGEGDLIAHVSKHAERLVSDVADAELTIVPQQGHLLHYAMPELVVTAMEKIEDRRQNEVQASQEAV